ncbi:hypothetical protein [Yersinia phage fHe-Yen9-04]|uniref:Uncharacterized protein n=2 Tax=Eneladusvirus Yen904 TaxID=2560849 RepID=A0A2C9CY38_9CAUD|nr:hypothetical protein FDJ41_gp413 [Yersinia phage fHe-Yen9-04]SOK58767.1 hypothetical protein [Yersinia phage fHe-Yen9-04]SOK59302.1 hypothetical protein [Yersinia phage fHe-Yen9-03]VUE36536.1 hypothetical protein [Yersinia phage fHe-Yen9-04]
MEISKLVSIIKEKELEIQEQRNTIKQLYEDNMARFSVSKNIITPEINENYKKIDSTFSAKAKLEAGVRSLQKQILCNLLEE